MGPDDVKAKEGLKIWSLKKLKTNPYQIGGLYGFQNEVMTKVALKVFWEGVRHPVLDLHARTTRIHTQHTQGFLTAVSSLPAVLLHPNQSVSAIPRFYVRRTLS